MLKVASLLAIAASIMSCGGGGEDTVRDIPPPPNGATLTWDAVSATDLAGYRIYYGPSSGAYLQPYGQGIPVGKVTVYTVKGLTSGVRYYFAATAYDSSNNESGFSNEVFKDIP